MYGHSKPLSGTLLDQAHYISTSNQLLWGVRFRQRRVKAPTMAEDCYIPPVILSSGIIGETDCFHKPVEGNMNEAGYGGLTKDNRQLYNYSPNNDGFVYDLVPVNRTNALRVVAAMMCDPAKPVDVVGTNRTTALWHNDLLNRTVCIPFLDSLTSSLHTIIQVYNPNYNIFARMELSTLFTVSGAVVNSVDFTSATLDQAEETNVAGRVVRVMLITAMLIEMIFWVQEIRHGTVRLFSFAAFIDLLIHILSAVFIFDIAREWLDYTAETLVTNLANIGTFTDLSDSLSFREAMNVFQGLLILLLILRLFKYLNFIRGLQVVYRTVMSAGVDIAYFFVLFVAIMMAFVFAGYVVFGPTTERFSSIDEAVITILRMVVLDFDYKIFQDAGFSGILYLFGSMFFFYFLLVNVFTAIVLSSWQTEKRKMDEDTTQRVQLPGVRWMSWVYYVLCCGWLIDVCKIITNPAKSCRKLCATLKDYSSRMDSHEVMIRLEQWHGKKINSRTQFMDFERIQQALSGGQANRREISPHQVQIVMKLCKQKSKGDPKLILTKKEMERAMVEMENEDIEDFAVTAKGSALESVNALKRLTNALAIVHKNQRGYWRDAMETLTNIQDQTMQAQNKLHTISTKVDGMTT